MWVGVTRLVTCEAPINGRSYLAQNSKHNAFWGSTFNHGTVPVKCPPPPLETLLVSRVVAQNLMGLFRRCRWGMWGGACRAPPKARAA